MSSISDYSRTLITLVKITLPCCVNVFGTAPCTAAGVECFNTYHTCKDRAHFSDGQKEYLFSSADTPIPFAGPRPYVKKVTYLPTEITTNLTKTGRVKVEFADEVDGDVGIDPYVTNRALWPDIPGTFFKKLIARNPNYRRATMQIYEGVLGQTESEFTQKAHVLLETGKLGNGTFTFESIDLLAGLSDIQIPAKVELKLLSDINSAVTEFILADTDDADTLATSGYLRIDDEVIQYSSYDVSQRRVYGCTRGAFATEVAEHDADEAVQPCRYFAPANPFDHLQTMLLTDAAYDNSLVDAAAFTSEKAWPGEEINLSALFTVPQKLNDVYMQLVDLLDCKSWVAEDLKITIRRNIPNRPDRIYVAWSDDTTIIKGSASVDLNEESRQTRLVLYWEKDAIGDSDKPESYHRIDIAVESEAETEYGDAPQDTIYTHWITASGIQEEIFSAWKSDTLLRRLLFRRDAAPIITASVDPKDGEIKVGDYLIFTTDEICNPDGTPINTRFQVVRREPASPGKITYKLKRMPVRRGCFYAPETATNYNTATDAEREYGGFYANELGLNSDGTEGFYYY